MNAGTVRQSIEERGEWIRRDMYVASVEGS